MNRSLRELVSARDVTRLHTNAERQERRTRTRKKSGGVGRTTSTTIRTAYPPKLRK